MSWFEEASKRKKWLVGVSGGADSVALLHLLVENGFKNLVVCHLDHRLRGRASTADAAFVGRLADKLELPLESGRINAAEEAKARKESIETTARHLRHEFFRHCAAHHRCSRVVLAHHADDQAETVLWNLLRGSYGAKGMKPVHRIDGLEIHRPLLGWRRQAIRDWLSVNGLKWRDDVSNFKSDVIRNRIRNEALPLLSEISGRDSIVRFNRLLDDFGGHFSILDFALKNVDITDNQNRIHLPSFRKLPPALQRAWLANYLSEHSIQASRKWIDEMLLTIETANQPVVNLPGGKRFRRRAGRAFIE